MTRSVAGDWEDTTPATRYPTVESFVTDHLAPMIRPRLEGPVRWCPQWHQHPEAVDRLTALWHAWEHLHRTPGVGLSNWWLNHADPHLKMLFDAEHGPFWGCHKGHTQRAQSLPVAPEEHAV